MIETQGTAAIAAEIGRRLDELASALALDSTAVDPDGWAESLAALSRFAKSVECREVAAAADEVADAFRQVPEWIAADEARHQLAQGIDRLRHVFPVSTPSKQDDASESNLATILKLIRDFVSESREHLDRISSSRCWSLDRSPADMEAIHSVFRSFHTIKGLAGFLAFDVIQTLAHEVETVLDLARNSELLDNAACYRCGA